jgi:hypothetical protein
MIVRAFGLMAFGLMMTAWAVSSADAFVPAPRGVAGNNVTLAKCSKVTEYAKQSGGRCPRGYQKIVNKNIIQCVRSAWSCN